MTIEGFSPDASRVPGERLHQLDGLRALAVSAVIVYHLGINSFADRLNASGFSFWGEALGSATSSGVELFFVLSGIVLLRPYLRQGRPFDWKGYVRRRIERLWPPFLAAWLIAGLVILLAGRYPTWWTRGASLPTFNVYTWLSQAGIVYLGRDRFNWAWWSLTVEIIFYLLIPLIVPLLLRVQLTRAQMMLIWVASVIVAVAVNRFPVKLVPYQAIPVRSLGVYCSCFAAGSLLAKYDFAAAWGWKIFLAGLAYVAFACRWPSLNVHAGWGALYLGLVTVALDKTSALARWFSRWIFIWLGERSYSLFLVHFSVFTIVCHAASLELPEKGWRYYLVSRLIELPLALLVSMLIFVFIEQRYAHNLVSARAFWPTCERHGHTDSRPAARAAIDMPAA